MKVMVNIMYTYTPKQAVKLANMWNTHANDKYQLSANKVHLMFHDNSDLELQNQGYTVIELRGHYTITGNPITFTVTTDYLTKGTCDA